MTVGMHSDPPTSGGSGVHATRPEPHEVAETPIALLPLCLFSPACTCGIQGSSDHLVEGQETPPGSQMDLLNGQTPPPGGQLQRHGPSLQHLQRTVRRNPPSAPDRSLCLEGKVARHAVIHSPAVTNGLAGRSGTWKEHDWKTG